MKKQGRAERRQVDGIVLLDKPLGLTSNAALQRVKRLYRADKAGHTGSLDPLATGLLPICFGQATKLCGFLLDADKTYRATAKLGERTSTGDAEGEVVERRGEPVVTAAMLEAAIPKLLGEIEQIPPMYSAIKREGRPLYELAREGVEIEREPRRVTIHALRLTGFEGATFSFELHCSKGTYVRTLAEDWAGMVGQVAHLTALRRLESAPFRDPVMVSAETLEALASDAAALDAYLLPLASALVNWRQVVVDAADAVRLRRGLACGPLPGQAPGMVAVLDAGGVALAIAEVDAGGLLHSRRWLGTDAALG
jgi:tRNA pseudouridine55 synthase